MESFFCFLDEELDEIEVPLECQLVEDGVGLIIFEGENIQVGVFLEVVAEFVDVAVAEEQLDDLAFLPAGLGRRIHRIVRKYYKLSLSNNSTSSF